MPQSRPGVSRDNFHACSPLSARTDPAHCFRTGRYLNREDAWVLPGGRQFVEAVATIPAKSWSTKGRSPGSEALGLKKMEKEKRGGGGISWAGLERRRPFKLLIPNKIEMNSSHGSCTFPRVNYLSLHLPNESAVPVIKQLHFTMASSSSTNTVPPVCSLVPAACETEREKGKGCPSWHMFGNWRPLTVLSSDYEIEPQNNLATRVRGNCTWSVDSRHINCFKTKYLWGKKLLFPNTLVIPNLKTCAV